MSIYGIYNIKEKEQCLRIGTLGEVARFLEVTAKELDKALRNKNLIRKKYKVCYLFKE